MMSVINDASKNAWVNRIANANGRIHHRGSSIQQQGIGLPIAIFVITVLSAFAVNMGLLVQDNASGRSEYITSLRASLAADTGADLGVECGVRSRRTRPCMRAASLARAPQLTTRLPMMPG